MFSIVLLQLHLWLPDVDIEIAREHWEPPVQRYSNWFLKWWGHIFLPRACSLVLYLPMRLLWLQVTSSDIPVHLQTFYKLIKIQEMNMDFLYFSWFYCCNKGNADFIMNSCTAKGGSSQSRILSFAAKQEWSDESICLPSRTLPHSRNWYSQLLYHQCSSEKRFQSKSEGEIFPFLLRPWSNPGLKLWSFSYSVFLKWVKIGKTCLPVLLAAFFFKLSVALAL